MPPEPRLEEAGAEPPEPVTLPPPAPSKRELWLEVLAVCFIGVLPDLWNTLGFLIAHPAKSSLYAREAYILFRSVQVSWLVLYLMARSKTPWSHFGIAAPRWVLDTLAAFGATLIVRLCYSTYARVVMAAVPVEAVSRDTRALTELMVHPATSGQTMLLVIAALANGFAEELVMRGYLIPRFEDLFGSPARAVLLSAVLFASYHLYQGFYGAGSALVIGLVFGVLFCSMRRLWPLAAAHAFLNLSAMLQ